MNLSRRTCVFPCFVSCGGLGGDASVASERDSVESLVEGSPASQAGPQAGGRREEEESLTEVKLLQEGRVET